MEANRAIQKAYAALTLAIQENTPCMPGSEAAALNDTLEDACRALQEQYPELVSDEEAWAQFLSVHQEIMQAIDAIGTIED